MVMEMGKGEVPTPNTRGLNLKYNVLSYFSKETGWKNGQRKFSIVVCNSIQFL